MKGTSFVVVCQEQLQVKTAFQVSCKFAIVAWQNNGNCETRRCLNLSRKISIQSFGILALFGFQEVRSKNTWILRNIRSLCFVSPLNEPSVPTNRVAKHANLAIVLLKYPFYYKISAPFHAAKCINRGQTIVA